MIHPSGKGIYCDLCGKEVLIENNSITYYSSNVKKVISEKNMPNNIQDVLDMDYCESCYKIFYDRVYKVSLINDEKRKSYKKHV
jgi:hypothetical protein